jgi:WD40 repeat protein
VALATLAATLAADPPKASGSVTLALGQGQYGEIAALAITPDGRFAVSGGWDHAVAVWEIATDREIRRFESHHNRVTSLSLGPDGCVVSASHDGNLQRWSMETLARAWDPQSRASPSTPDSTRLLRPLAPRRDRDSIAAVAVDRRGRYVAVAGRDGIHYRDFDSGEHQLRVHGLGVLGKYQPEAHAVGWLPDGSMVLAGYADGAVRTWDPSQRRPVRTYQAHDGPVTRLAVAGDGLSFASGSPDRTVRVWETHSGRLLATLRHAAPVLAVAMNHDGRLVLSSAGDGSVTLWNAATGDTLRRLGHLFAGELFTAAALDSAGTVAQGGSRAGHLVRWGVATGVPVGLAITSFWKPEGIAITPRQLLVAASGRWRSVRMVVSSPSVPGPAFGCSTAPRSPWGGGCIAGMRPAWTK